MRRTPENLHRAYEVARYKAAGKTFLQIGKILGIDRTVASRVLDFAKAEGLYIEVAVPPKGDSELEKLQADLIAHLPIRSAIVVPGWDALVPRDESLWQRPLPTDFAEARHTVFRTATQAAAEYLDAQLTDEDTLCLAYGVGMHLMMQSLRPSRPRPQLQIVPMIGMLSTKTSSIESSVLVQQAAAAFKTENYFWLPCPAFAGDEHQQKTVRSLDLVQDVLKKIKSATFVVTGIGVPPEGLTEHTLVKDFLRDHSDVEELRKQKAVGELAGMWFDASGTPLPSKSTGRRALYPIGLQITEMKEIVRRGDRLMIVAAADYRRVNGLFTTIKHGICNILITDSATAKALLRKTGITAV